VEFCEVSFRPQDRAGVVIARKKRRLAIEASSFAIV
jgi:hypothetical protein